jgi:hypothetical protein
MRWTDLALGPDAPAARRRRHRPILAPTLPCYPRFPSTSQAIFHQLRPATWAMSTRRAEEHLVTHNLHMEGMEGLLTDQHTQLSLTGAHETHALPVLSVHGSIPGGNGRIMTLFASLGCPSGQQFPEVSAAVPKTAPPLVCPPVPSGISSGGPVTMCVPSDEKKIHGGMLARDVCV